MLYNYYMFIKSIQPGKKNKDRFNIYSDDGFAFSVYAETAVTEGLKEGMELSEARIAEIRETDERKYALETALGFLETRMRSEKEIRDRLKRAEISSGSIDNAVERLKGLGYIDDGQYAMTYAAELSGRYGAGMIRQKLRERGISGETAEKAVESVDTDGSMIEWIEKLAFRYRDDDVQKARQKMIRNLIAKGYRYDDIKGPVERALKSGRED